MLEEILRKINENLERIAIVEEKLLETSIEPIKVIENTEKISPNTVETAVNIPTGNAAVNNPVVNNQESKSIPTTPMNESFTMEQLAVAMSNAVSAGKMDLIQKILQSFGVQALTQIQPADYNKLATVLKENGVEV